MTQIRRMPLSEIKDLSLSVLAHAGYGAAHAEAITDTLYACQLDDCQSHGLFRLFMCCQTMRSEAIDGDVQPVVQPSDGAVVRADARGGMSLLAFDQAAPLLIEKTRHYGIAALAINNCYHFSALWPEVERLSAAGLAGLAMVPSHAWGAPAGGTRGSLGTNPLAFSWPRAGKDPFTFDFATSGFARGEIELYKRAGKPLPEGVAIDKDGQPTTDPQAALDGAMLTFGGYKGSALSIMIELLAGPLIDDLTSLESMEIAKGAGAAPYHGEMILAFDPDHFSGGRVADNDARAERLFADILDQGARLPSQRRFAARRRNLARGYVEISEGLYQDLRALLQS
ncbi:(2R)-3-sulfolactate dehydrogenase (NADP(+)) [Tritonibacter multivorans]|uniref:(2R)-3-sulfolactate dehydrogenase (NADP(+)) n=1 Tax=Tritonibacter multivorans TaxID=928856 RepID=A0A0P1GG35_9RHOB|nr:Ldh family oxidoreductase [Tritonibacter multivorans]MDA7420908.1 Ldh family oxidoreductase [Tritonibacter multivorans]CUH80538.1 (2R)-3-sulfolactate dehydrogenase (NADP(+)) [Tritonibacter multivorans]SFC82487.1 Malate/lactate/ureidoglycolate dehydrogenase, LDH2 family [Tritonibacter multivorans]